MPKEAKAFKEGSGWAMRRRILGQDLYVSGKTSALAARKEMEALVSSLKGEKKPFGLGSQLTTLGQALQDFALVHLPRLKGARQEKDRINRYLRSIGLDIAELREPAPRDAAKKEDEPQQGKRGRRYFDVELVATTPHAPRKFPRGLKRHRESQALNCFESDRLRMLLAGTAVGKVTRHQVQRLMDRLTAEGASPATVALERALLRRFFNYAHRTWHWSDVQDNPAQGLTLPAVDETPRLEGLLSAEDEERLMAAALGHCRSEQFAPLLELLVETGMRTSEPLDECLRWKHVDLEARLLRLEDSKTGAGNVPLTLRAVEALQRLKALGNGAPEEKVVSMSYEALKACFRRACEHAGLKDVQLYDLRRTAACRLALESGNIFLVKELLRHKTLEMSARYTKALGAGNVVEYFKKREQEQAHGGEVAKCVAPKLDAQAVPDQVHHEPPCDARLESPAASRIVSREGSVVAVRFGTR